MKKLYSVIICVLLLPFFALQAQTQTINNGTAKIALFLPLYLNEAFLGGAYQLEKNALPQNILQGLEFYNGAMLAIDSLSQEDNQLQVNIYDTKQPAEELKKLFAGSELNNAGLIIASFTSAGEVKMFADQALAKNIPLISATYPSIGSVTVNPFFVLLNSSFQTHIVGLFNYLNTNNKTDKIIAFKQPGATSNFIKSKMAELNTSNGSGALNIKWVDLANGYTVNDVQKHLDSTVSNTVFVASPVESFGLNLVKTLSTLEAYRTTAVGMPTWDGIKELNGKHCRNVDIVYSTPFNYSRTDDYESGIIKKYKLKFYSRPSDMVFRGFESVYHFGRLLLRYRGDLINNLSDKEFKVFNDFDVHPVKLRESNAIPDYLENKKLYFIRKQEGNIKSIS